jgi:hypothetical protein
MLLTHISQSFETAFYPRLSEWFAAGVLLMIGWVLLNNTDLMQTTLPFEVKTSLLRIMSQSSWSVAFLFLGFARVVVLMINGAIRKSPWLRAIAASLSCFMWLAMFASFWSVQGIGMVLAGGYLGMDFVNIIRAMRDARQVDDAYRGRHGRAIGIR